jgi:hypothetical protein
MDGSEINIEYIRQSICDGHHIFVGILSCGYGNRKQYARFRGALRLLRMKP